MEGRSVSVRERDAVGLDGTRRGLRVDEILWLSGKSGCDPGCHTWLRSDDSALGIQRQRAALLGLYFRRQIPAAGTSVAPLWIEPERDSAPGGIPGASG